ncbi:unnamed protein product [Brachionus calyciflorus]|uniref:Reverse transcriptase RNase H-like domain-containing protein n=1 Tax=Brachionus calyciflorus TaxID=104777 RepID=A0A813SU43_9BILA|nr:unnamed protein product [Brachionus calyciflorus]
MFYFVVSKLMHTFYILINLNFEKYVENDINDLNSNIHTLVLSQSVKLNINQDLINPHVFRRVSEMRIYGEINSFQKDLLKYFNNLKSIILDGQNFRKFMHKTAIDWINYLNINKTINPLKMRKVYSNYESIVNISITFNNRNYVLYYYEDFGLLFNVNQTFPDEDFCIYKNFPFNQLIHIYFDSLDYNSIRIPNLSSGHTLPYNKSFACPVSLLIRHSFSVIFLVTLFCSQKSFRFHLLFALAHQTLDHQANGRERIIKYISRPLTKNERKWDIREKEALAILWACEQFRPFIFGTRFIVEADHQSLQWLMKLKSPARLVRWALRLSEFDFEIRYKKATLNYNVDALSRLIEDENDESNKISDEEFPLEPFLFALSSFDPVETERIENELLNLTGSQQEAAFEQNLDKTQLNSTKANKTQINQQTFNDSNNSQNIKNTIKKEIHQDHYNLTNLNFFHNIDIINGFNNSKYIDDNNNINDADGDFYILPNDEIDTNSEMLSDLVCSKLQLIDEIRSIRKIVNGFTLYLC